MDKETEGTKRKRTPRQYNRPLIFVPGFMASILERPAGGMLQPQRIAWPLNVLTIATQLGILRNSKPLQAHGLVGNYYDGLLEFISNPVEKDGLGRTTDENFWIFTYDWRQSNHISGEKLAKFTREKLAQANAQRAAQKLPLWRKIDVINHSMGGFVTRSAQKEFKAPFRRITYLASGHYGFPKAYFALHPDTVTKLLDDFIKDFIPGWYWDLIKVLPNVWFLQGWLAKLLRTFPSMYELLPDNYYLEQDPALLINSTPSLPQRVVGVDETYFQNSWKLPPELHQKIWYGLKFKEQLGRDLPGKYNMTIYADNIPTYTSATFGGHLEHPERLPIGDGTVSASSANRATPAKLVVIEASHTQIPNLPETHKVVRRFLLTGK